MQILSQNNLDIVVKLLRAGKTIIFPTETSYGLGCDATNQRAVDKIFKIKGRPENKSMLVVVPDVAAAKKYLVWNDLLEKISQKYWPGPLTVVGRYNKKSFWQFWKRGLAGGAVSAENTVAIRVTDHPLVNELTLKFGRPVVATSANISGGGDSYDSQDVIRQFSDQQFSPDVLIDGSALPFRPPTTIVSVAEGQLKVLRQGECIINF